MRINESVFDKFHIAQHLGRAVDEVDLYPDALKSTHTNA